MEHLHTEEYEILLPDRLPDNHEQPFLLSIGPSLTMVIPILLMALVGGRIYGSNSSFIYMTLITGGTGALLACFWGVTNHIYRRMMRNQLIEDREREFNEYLAKSDEYLSRCMTENQEYMNREYSSVGVKLQNIDEGHLYKRYRLSDDYLFVRLGTGKIPFQMKITVKEDRHEMFMSKEALKAYELKDKFRTLSDVPVGIDLRCDRIVGLALPENELKTYELITNIMLDIAYSHEPSEFKILVLYDAANRYQFDLAQSIRNLPHLLTEGGAVRLLAGCESDVNFIIPYLNSFSDDRATLVVFLLSDRFILEESFCQRIFSENAKEYIFVLKEKDMLPNNTTRIIDEEEANGYDKSRFALASSFGRKLMALKGYEAAKSQGIPDSVDFLELFNAKKIHEIDVIGLWEKNLPGDRLKCPIGRTAGNRKLYLDIHEKYHGPHGLIAGTTGSGKSELIQTYIMSLCISYSPSEVNFFLIDYKGGGTGNYISDLPHCAGTISNLSGNQISRAMKAISSENKRRQRLLAKAGVNHIDRYQELYRSGEAFEPMPHLVLVIDEFAELKKEEPEFMRAVISLAAVGRSLGIHLILATQKPAGVVDDKIWSNSNFKLCLRVQDRQDSMDMLHRPEASRLTRPGQCYIQVGNDEYFEQFQTGYCGGIYREADADVPKVRILSDCGERYELPDENYSNDLSSKLEALVNYICLIAKQADFEPAKRLWMPELPSRISIEECLENIKCVESFVLGMYDDPSNQSSGVFVYSPESDGHLCIIGGPATGKSQVLRTILEQMPGTNEYLLIDISQNEIMTYVSELNCMGYLGRTEDIDIFCYHLRKEYQKRKRSEGELTRLFIIIDNFGLFWKKLTEVEQEFMAKLVGEGISLNIFFVITGSLITDVNQKLLAKFRTTMALEMNDKYAYGDIMRQYHLDVTPQTGTAGRALYRVNGQVLECQVACGKCNKEIQDKKLTSKKFPVIPENVTFSMFLKEVMSTDGRYENYLPIGYSLKSGYIRGVELTLGGALIISGQEESGKYELLEKIKMTLMSVNNISEGELLEVDEDCEMVEQLIDCRVALAKNLGALVRRAHKDSLVLEAMSGLEKGLINGTGPMLIGAINPTTDQDILSSGLIRLMKEKGYGICLGGNLTSQRLFEFNDIPFNEANMKQKKEIGYVTGNKLAKTMRVLIPLDEREDEEDDYD